MPRVRSSSSVAKSIASSVGKEWKPPYHSVILYWLPNYNDMHYINVRNQIHKAVLIYQVLWSDTHPGFSSPVAHAEGAELFICRQQKRVKRREGVEVIHPHLPQPAPKWCVCVRDL